jgi:hypothetical protein
MRLSEKKSLLEMSESTQSLAALAQLSDEVSEPKVETTWRSIRSSPPLQIAFLITELVFQTGFGKKKTVHSMPAPTLSLAAITQ